MTAGRRAAAVALATAPSAAAALATVALATVAAAAAARHYLRCNPRFQLTLAAIRAVRAGGTVVVNAEILGTLLTWAGRPALVTGCVIKPLPGRTGIQCSGGPATFVNNLVQPQPEPPTAVPEQPTAVPPTVVPESAAE